MLLDSQRGDQYPVYPKPLLSDFGAGHILYKEDPRQDESHPNTYPHDSTAGFFPPEMRRRTKYGIERGIEDKPLYSWTNIWQTGRIIECLMNLKQRMDHEKFSLVAIEDSWIKQEPPRFEKFPDFRYSDDLIDLVWRCQRHEPEQRPTPAELLKLIRERAPKHNLGMEEWGNATWIQEQERKKANRPKTYAGVLKGKGPTGSMKKREAAGKLGFLNAYPPEWAKRYYDLDMDLPNGAEMLFYGNKDYAKVNTRAYIPPKKKFDPLAGVDWAASFG